MRNKKIIIITLIILILVGTLIGYFILNKKSTDKLNTKIDEIDTITDYK